MKIWDKFLRYLDNQYGDKVVNKWLRSLKISKFDAGNIYLDNATQFHANWYNEYAKHFEKKILTTSSGKFIKVHFNCFKKAAQPFNEAQPSPNTFTHPIMDKHATFENYFNSEKTCVCLTLLKELCTQPLKIGKYNPIYIYGPKNCGKTHLLTAVTHKLTEFGKKCLYVPADIFTEHVIKAFRLTQLKEFRDVYRNVDVLVIDDIHQLARKTATQEELFHTFNYLHNSSKQIILSSCSSTHSLEHIEDRLISRFEWGIVLSMKKTTIEQLKQILEKKLNQLQIKVTPEIFNFILKTFGDPKSLLKAVNALALRLKITHDLNDILIVKHVLADLIELQINNATTSDTFIKLVSKIYGLKISDIVGKSQSRECCLPRQLTMYLLRENLSLSYKKIGSLFGRDHSTVISSIRRVKKGIKAKEEAVLLPLREINKELT